MSDLISVRDSDGNGNRISSRSILTATAAVAFVVFAQGAVSCGSSAKPTGTLYVTVRNTSTVKVADVLITTLPATKSAVTDALGSVVLTIPVGTYAVTATHPVAGAGREPVVVVANQIQEVNIVLDPTPSVSPGAPTAIIFSPPSGTVVAQGSRVMLRGSVADDKDVPSLIAASWRSDLDGVLLTQPPLVDGSVAGAVSSLSVGTHLITLQARDSDGLTGSDSISLTVTTTIPDAGTDRGIDSAAPVPDAHLGTDVNVALDATTPADALAAGSISLNALVKDSNGVDLTWSITPPGAFTSYRIYRGGGGPGATAFSIINILQDAAALKYRDDTGMLATAYSFRVGGLTATGQEIFSNTQTITTGVSIVVGSQVETMLIDSTRPYLYALDRVNNSLHFIDLTTNAKEKSIFVGSSPVDMDMNPAGTKLYVANFGGTQIAVVDLATRVLAAPITVDTTIGTWDGNPYRLACLAGDTLVFTSMDQWCDLKLVNALTGANLDSKGSIYQPDLVAAPGGTTFYVGESGSTGSGLTRWDVVASKMVQVDESANVGGYGSRLVLASRDGMYVFYGGKKFLAKNLKSELGTFSEPIVAINADGSLAVGSKNLHDGTTFAVKRPTPISTTVMALSTDGTTLYLYDSMSSNIFLYKVK